MNVENYLAEKKVLIDNLVDSHFAKTKTEKILKDSMLYSLKNGGKKLRPTLLLTILKACGCKVELGYKTSIALEMIHTYSLIHDDLPAMDNDDLRRGKPTNHIVYGEDIAILAGDALLTEAFRIIATDQLLTPQVRIKLIDMLSTNAGIEQGMINGQVLDMISEKKSISLDDLKEIHSQKTGALLEFACVAAGVIANLSSEKIQLLKQFSMSIGLAFQIKDDILDVIGDESVTGKKVGSDMINHKTTYCSLLGIEKAKVALENEINFALKSLSELAIESDELFQLVNFIAQRQL